LLAFGTLVRFVISASLAMKSQWLIFQVLLLSVASAGHSDD
jgi:hypothetical protein